MRAWEHGCRRHTILGMPTSMVCLVSSCKGAGRMGSALTGNPTHLRVLCNGMPPMPPSAVSVVALVGHASTQERLKALAMENTRRCRDRGHWWPWWAAHMCVACADNGMQPCSKCSGQEQPKWTTCCSMCEGMIQ